MAGGIGGRLDDRSISSWVKKAKAGTAAKRKLFDGGGLYLTLTNRQAPVWRIKYRHGGVERTYADLGAYPSVGLKAARATRDEVKAALKAGRDPVQARLLARAAAVASAGQTFEEVTKSWLDAERKRKRWSAVHFTKSKRALERDVLPRLGKLPIAEIPPATVTDVVKAIMARGVRDTAAKILQHVTGVFTYAQAHGLRTDNPALPAQKILPKASASVGRPALLKFTELGDVLRRADLARLSPAVRLAHRLCAFAPGARISNIVAAEWHEFALDAEAPSWTIPRAKMKARDRHHDHKIILGPAIVEELKKWHAATGGEGYLFAGVTGKKYITREALEKVYRRTLALGDKHTPHGWRAAFSTLARDEGFERDAVELALDHIHDNEVVRAYDRGERLQQRIRLATWWSDRLAQAQRGAEVVQMRKVS